MNASPLADPSNYIILVAGSGRMLAEAARIAGLKPLVIDLYADRDTQDLAEDYCQVRSLASSHLSQAIDYFIQKYSAAHVIYGSGLECFPESVTFLGNQLNILGNDAATFNRLLDKKRFFNYLNLLDIPHPDSSFVKPDNNTMSWLVKPLRGQGGSGIKRYQQNAEDYSGVYWQQYQSGRSHSVLFLANGIAFRVIGFNRQWTVGKGYDDTFTFSGVMNYTLLTDEQKQGIVTWLNQLVPLYQLKGLNSLDFIQNGENSYLLEINPRPSASMALYSGDLMSGHIQASQGLLLDVKPDRRGVTGYQIVYARTAVLITTDFDWPDACRDLPATEVFINAGQPICSIIAHQNEATAVLQQLSHLENTILNKLERSQIHAIYR